MTRNEEPGGTTPRLLAGQAAEIIEAERVRVFGRTGARVAHRRQVERAIELAERALQEASATEAGFATVLSDARACLVKALALRAEDARHGAGQLARGSQRAPTRQDCEDGWQRVAEIVAVAANAAAQAMSYARALDTPEGWRFAAKAEAAAAGASAIVDERNDAYTFHTDPGFSFGEGWYVAAAGIFDSVSIQIEPGHPATPKAERFLRDAGLEHCFVPYRSRPRANKHLTEIVARAFRADPTAAQRTLRARFLGEEAIPLDVAQWADDKLAHSVAEKRVLLWQRRGTYHPHRNTTRAEIAALSQAARDVGLAPVIIGEPLPDGGVPTGCADLTHFHRHGPFQGVDTRRKQLQLFEHLRRAHGLVGQIGVTSAGMDGPALMGLPTVYISEEPYPRFQLWVGAVPGYQQMVRDGNYMTRIRRTLERWGDEQQAG